MITVGGICLLAGAGLQAWSADVFRKRGARWRGVAILAAGSLLYSAVMLSGIFLRATAVGVALTFLAAGTIWAGVVVTMRERRASHSS